LHRSPENNDWLGFTARRSSAYSAWIAASDFAIHVAAFAGNSKF
jgi:hypothetical protein